MFKIGSVALSAALGVAAVAQSTPVEAHPYVSVGFGLPGVAVIDPLVYAPGYYAPYYYAHGRYWRRDLGRDRYDHFRREHWDRR